MPVPEIEAVVALTRLAGAGTEVLEVPRSVGHMVVVVSGRRPCAGLVPAPGRVVAIPEVLGRTVRVRIVPCGEDGPADGVQELGRQLST